MLPKIIIGIPLYNEEDSIAFVVKQIDEGIQKFYNPKECLIINLDSDSEDKTKEIFLGRPRSRTPNKFLRNHTGQASSLRGRSGLNHLPAGRQGRKRQGNLFLY